MKIVIPTKHLQSAIATIRPICPLKPTPAILGNVLIETGEQRINITGTDTDKRLTVSVSCAVLKPGSVSIPVQRMLNLISAYDASETTIELGAKSIASFTCGSGWHKIHGLPSDEFPASPALEIKDSVRIDGPEIKRILSVCAAHAATEDSRATLKSVTLRERDGKLSFESGDGRRGCVVLTNIDLKTRDKYVVPIEAIKAMSGFDSECYMEFCEATVRVKSSTNEFVTKCIEFQPPDFLRIISGAGGDIKAEFNREEMIGAIKRAKAITNDITPGVKLSCRESKILVEGRGKDIGEGGDTGVPCKDDCTDFDLGVNPDFMLSMLESLSGEYVTMRVKDGMTPFAVTEDQTHIAISPIRIE